MADIRQQFEAHIPTLRRYARALVRDTTAADDLVQECLTRALIKLHLWRDGSNLRAWLLTILHNQHVNRIRRSIREGTTVELSEAGSLLVLSRPATQEKHLELRDLGRALGLLPEEQRAAILLVGLEGMRYDEASEVLGVPVGTVRSRLSRGRLALRRLMDVESTQRDEPAVASAPRRSPLVDSDLRLEASDAR
jgi:RNA polymerase sigma-70 factor, ECF subfamily